MLTRRNVLFSGAAVVAMPLAMASCPQNAAILAAYNNFLAQVQAIVAKGCGVVEGFIPTIPTIEAIVSILYPGAGAAVAGIGGAITAVASKLCSAMPANPPASLRKKLMASGPGNPVLIGTIIVNGVAVQVSGYR